MGDDRDVRIAELRRDLTAHAGTIEALQSQVRAQNKSIDELRRQRTELDEELRGRRESYNRASTALSAAGVPHVVPGAGTDEDERMAERVRFLARLHPLFVWPRDAEAIGKLAKVNHLLGDHRRKLEALLRMASNRVDLNSHETREIVIRLVKAELERIRLYGERQGAGITIGVGVDMAKPGTEMTVVLVRVCGCGKNPACPEGPSCPQGFHIARRV